MGLHAQYLTQKNQTVIQFPFLTGRDNGDEPLHEDFHQRPRAHEERGVQEAIAAGKENAREHIEFPHLIQIQLLISKR